MKFEMPQQKFNIDNKNERKEDINILEVFEKYKYHWKWLVMSSLFALSLAYVYIRYSHNQYQVSTTIFINDDKSGGLKTELSAFEDLGVMSSSGTNSIINETGILKSYTLTEKVIKNLGLNITYYLKGEIITTEIYEKDIPYKINFFVNDSVLYKLNTLFKILRLSKTKHILMDSNDEIIENIVFGTTINTNIGDINITPLNLNSVRIGETIIVKISPLKSVAANYNRRINIGVKLERSSLLEITLVDEVKEKAKDILNELVLQYNKDGILYKSMITQNTDAFINERIKDISIDLLRVDKGVENFKTKNKITDLSIEASLNLDSNSELQLRIQDLNSQLKLIEYISEHIKNNDKDLIPANLGLQDMSMNQNTQMYNKLLLERNRIIKGSSALNPTVINLDLQLTTLKQSIEQSLLNLRSSLEYSLTEARNQQYRIGAKKSAVPVQEREFQDIIREQKIIESLYLYLLQKREENAISLGIPVPNAKIIDKADGSDVPIFPKPKLVYIMAGILGLISSIVVISIKSLLDIKVHNTDDVEEILKAPIISEIPKYRSKEKIVVTENAKSGIAESFRLLRTNVNFMLAGAKDGSKTIFVTSTLSGEGKTFIAINLAASLALLNKKVILIGGDIRKPKISSYLNSKPEKGLTHFLMDDNLIVSDIIEHHKK